MLVAKPEFAFLNEAASALSEAQRVEAYELVAGLGIGYISVGERQPSLLASHDIIVELRSDGSWAVDPIDPQLHEIR